VKPRYQIESKPVPLKNLPRLLPDRHPQTDFFVCDIFDAVPKSDTASMEYPLFTLSTKPDYSEATFEQDNKWIKLAPSKLGRATVHDRDVLIYLISQCMAALNNGQKIDRTMRFQAQDMLVSTNRETSGDGYKRLKAALTRLQGTQIETNIASGGHEEWSVFSFIKEAKIIRRTRDGRMQEIEVELSDWVFNALAEKGGEILTISRDYFRLRKPLERRLYELARKHCGTKNNVWPLKLSTLHEKTGSQSPPREFKRMIKSIIDDHEHIPDYTFELVGETVYIRPRPEFSKRYKSKEKPSPVDRIHLKPKTYENAKELAGGWDLYQIEDDWRIMLHGLDKMPDKPDGSFVGYVKWYVKKHGTPTRG